MMVSPVQSDLHDKHGGLESSFVSLRSKAKCRVDIFRFSSRHFNVRITITKFFILTLSQKCLLFVEIQLKRGFSWVVRLLQSAAVSTSFCVTWIYWLSGGKWYTKHSSVLIFTVSKMSMYFYWFFNEKSISPPVSISGARTLSEHHSAKNNHCALY